MINQEILEGLRQAIYRRESLKNTMMSFLNAGYPKAEIEEAARALISEQQGVFQQTSEKLNIPVVSSNNLSQQTTSSSQQQQEQMYSQAISPAPTKQIQQAQIQKVSAYSKESFEKEKSKIPFSIIILGGVLFFLILALILMLIFKQPIMDFFNGEA